MINTFFSRLLNSFDASNALSPRDEQTARQLISDAAVTESLPRRINLISARLIGSPYIVGPLTGSATVPEQLIARMDGFDCVTFVETVLALASSHNIEQFITNLREIRYQDGEVEWRKRLHYMTDWSAYNVQRGFLKDMTVGEGTVLVERKLDFIRGLPPRQSQFRYFPKTSFQYVSRWLTDGDLIYFVSTDKDLDTYHIGLIVRQGEQLLLRHARHMRHRVYQQPLADFMKVIRSPGFIINRVSV